jgi:hypothetical protein
MTNVINDLVVQKAVELLAIRGCEFTVEESGGKVHSSRNKPVVKAQKPAKPVKKVQEPREARPLAFEGIALPDDVIANLKNSVEKLTQDNNTMDFDIIDGFPIELLKYTLSRECRLHFGFAACFVNYHEDRLGVNVFLRPPRPAK